MRIMKHDGGDLAAGPVRAMLVQDDKSISLLLELEAHPSKQGDVPLSVLLTRDDLGTILAELARKGLSLALFARRLVS